jgi:hypothetical protein
MTIDVPFCYDDEDAEPVARLAAELRLVNRNKLMVGILALADLATQGGTRPAANPCYATCGLTAPLSAAVNASCRSLMP